MITIKMNIKVFTYYSEAVYTLLGLHTVRDLVTTYPFEGAVNRTSAIVVEKICEIRDISNS
ncbi:MAG: hypothetical protein QXV08_08860 [Desulfurococcus sp.]|uniref:hypothetical protein n=1 Tax=Desulfurococcus sp. TaxID=51678 RepID=UPI00316FBE29